MTQAILDTIVSTGSFNGFNAASHKDLEIVEAEYLDQLETLLSGASSDPHIALPAFSTLTATITSASSDLEVTRVSLKDQYLASFTTPALPTDFHMTNGTRLVFAKVNPLLADFLLDGHPLTAGVTYYAGNVTLIVRDNGQDTYTFNAFSSLAAALNGNNALTSTLEPEFDGLATLTVSPT